MQEDGFFTSVESLVRDTQIGELTLSLVSRKQQLRDLMKSLGWMIKYEAKKGYEMKNDRLRRLMRTTRAYIGQNEAHRQFLQKLTNEKVFVYIITKNKDRAMHLTGLDTTGSGVAI